MFAAASRQAQGEPPRHGVHAHLAAGVPGSCSIASCPSKLGGTFRGLSPGTLNFPHEESEI